MSNKATIAFKQDNNKRVKYGKWVSDFGVLYFGGVRVAEKLKDGTIKVDKFSLVDCDFNYPMFHAIQKVSNYLNN